MTKTITIEVDDEHKPEHALQEVLRIVRDTGCTSGKDPTFDIVEN